MQGRILAFDHHAGEGHISGEDGQRYRFAAAEWKPQSVPRAGDSVDFEAEGREALAVYQLRAPPLAGDKSKVGAALLALFLGGLGIHKFYLNKNGAGIIMLLVSVFGFILAGIPTLIICLIAFVEAIIYLTASDADFERHYVRGNKEWF